MRLKGFLRTDEPGLGFGNACLDCKEILGRARAVFDGEFVGVLGTSEQGAGAITLIAPFVKFVGEFFYLFLWSFSGLCRVNTLLLG